MDHTRKSGFVAVVQVFATALLILVSTVQPVALAGLAGLAALKAVLVELRAKMRGGETAPEDEILAATEMTLATEVPVQAFAGRDFISAMSEKYAAEKADKSAQNAAKSRKSSPMRTVAAMLALATIGGAGWLSMNPSMNETARETALQLWQTVSVAALDKAQAFGFGIGQTVEAPMADAEKQSAAPIAQEVAAQEVAAVEPIIVAETPVAQVVQEVVPAAPMEPAAPLKEVTLFVQVDEEAAAMIPAVAVVAPIVAEVVPEAVAEASTAGIYGFAMTTSLLQAIGAMPQLAMSLAGMIALFAAAGLIFLTYQRRAVTKSPLVDPFERVLKLRRAELAREAQRMLGGGCLQRA